MHLEFERGIKGAEAGDLGCCWEVGAPESREKTLRFEVSESEVRRAAGSLGNLQTAA